MVQTLLNCFKFYYVIVKMEQAVAMLRTREQCEQGFPDVQLRF